MTATVSYQSSQVDSHNQALTEIPAEPSTLSAKAGKVVDAIGDFFVSAGKASHKAEQKLKQKVEDLTEYTPIKNCTFSKAKVVFPKHYQADS